MPQAPPAPPTAAQAKRAMLDLFIAQAVGDLTCSWAGPTKEEEVRDNLLWFGEVEQNEEWANSLGAQRRQEDYTVEVIANVYREGTDPEACETTAWDVRSEIATALRNANDLDGLLSEWAEVQTTSMTTYPVEGGWESRATIRVHCRSRI